MTGRAHEIWSAAQLAPGEGIDDGVARIEALLALPAPAGEPEMPVLDKALLDLIGNYGFENRNGRNEVEVTHHYCQLIAGIKVYARAWGDARAEHARRVAPGYVLVPVQPTRAMWTAGSDHCRHEDSDDTHAAIGRAIAVWSDMVAAAPPQGERT